MNLLEITPMILAANEEENIGRCLDELRWASQILVVDSFSTDSTMEICEKNPQVTVVQRAFDSLGQQANFGLSHVKTTWVLSLDADYLLTKAFVTELEALSSAGETSHYIASFIYAVNGQPLRGTLYPPRKVLYQKDHAKYRDDGHAHRVTVEGNSCLLMEKIIHDDRKPLTRWFQSQSRYAQLEAEKLITRPWSELSLTEKIRRLRFVAPFLNLGWCLIVKGILLDGRAGWFYAFQRFTAEAMLSVALLERDLRRK